MTPQGSKARGQRAEIWGRAPPTPVTQHPLPQSFHKQRSLPKPQPGVGPAGAQAPYFLVGGGMARRGSRSCSPSQTAADTPTP